MITVEFLGPIGKATYTDRGKDIGWCFCQTQRRCGPWKNGWINAP